jgi:hypothetical protein
MNREDILGVKLVYSSYTGNKDFNPPFSKQNNCII